VNHGFSIRKATSKDAPGILACLSAAFEDYRGSYTPAAFLDTVLTPATIEQRLQEMFVFAAADESGQIIGTVACKVIDKEEGHIRGMAVLPTWQGAGVAAQLLACAESQLGEKNCSRITLDTTEPLKRAIRFYERDGFRPSGKVKDFFGMPLFEYVKTISGPAHNLYPIRRLNSNLH
jgi:N-acetylglutamate synthase-like GNAT family acetyltransferase